MCVCMCVCAPCMNTDHTHARMHARTHAAIHTHTHTHTHILGVVQFDRGEEAEKGRCHEYMDCHMTHIGVFVHVCALCMNTDHMHSRMHARIHTCTHTHTGRKQFSA